MPFEEKQNRDSSCRKQIVTYWALNQDVIALDPVGGLKDKMTTVITLICISARVCVNMCVCVYYGNKLEK